MGATQVRSSQVLDASLTDADIATANIDGTTSTPSMRTLGTGAQQAAAGNDSRFGTVTPANEASDTSCFPLFVTAATGNQGPKTNAGLAFNSSTAQLSTTSLKTSTITGNSAVTTTITGGDTNAGISIDGNTGPITISTSTAYGTVDISNGFAPVTITSAISTYITGGGPALIVTSTSGAASVQAAVVQGDSASPADGDAIYVSYKLSNISGVQTEFVRETITAVDADNATEDASVTWSVIIGGSLTDKLILEGAALKPAANDGTALGLGTVGWADLYLASGGVIDWNNGNVTLAHSAGLLTLTGNATVNGNLDVSGNSNFEAATADSLTGELSGLTLGGGGAGFGVTVDDTEPLRVVNTTDSASVEAVRFEGDRATPANNDEIYTSYYLSDSAGNQTEFFRLTTVGINVTDGTETAFVVFGSTYLGTFSQRIIFSPLSISPYSDGLLALGATTNSWSALYLTSAGVINWGAGDITITASTNLLAFAGASSGYKFDNLLIVGGTASLNVGGAAYNAQIQGTTAAGGGLSLSCFSATAGTASELAFYRSKNASIGSATVVESGDRLGAITAYGAQQTSTYSTQNPAAQIRFEVDGTVTSGASGDMPGRIVFGTTADGSGTLTDRLVLDSAGIFKPNANDGVALGTSSLSFSDLFLANAAVINFASSNYTITHSSGLLTFSGAGRFDSLEIGHASDTTLTRSSAGVVAVEGKPVVTEDKLDDYGWVPLGTISASGASSSTFSSLGGSTYRSLMVVITGYVPVTDNTQLRLRINGDSGASNYRWCRNNIADTSANTPVGDSTADHIELGNALGNNTGEQLDGVLYIFNCAGSVYHNIVFSGSWINATPAFVATNRGGVRVTAAAVTSLEFTASSGNHAAEFRLYGIRNAAL